MREAMLCLGTRAAEAADLRAYLQLTERTLCEDLDIEHDRADRLQSEPDSDRARRFANRSWWQRLCGRL